MSTVNSKTEPDRRVYHSPLRESQAVATRERILEALVRTMANGVSELSVPAVAREAEVSVATIYRHFATKQELLTALPEYFARQSGMDRQWEVPETWDQYNGIVHRLFAAYARFNDVARAAMVSQLGRQSKRDQLPARVEFSRASLESLAPSLDGEALDRVNSLALVLVSSSSFHMYESLGLEAQEAADHAIWAIRTAIDGAERGR